MLHYLICRVIAVVSLPCDGVSESLYDSSQCDRQLKMYVIPRYDLLDHLTEEETLRPVENLETPAANP